MWPFGVKKDINKCIKEALISEDIRYIKERLKVLECDHVATTFVDGGVYAYTTHYGYDGRQYCSNCKKILRSFDNEKDFLEAKNKNLAELIKENEEKITKL